MKKDIEKNSEPVDIPILDGFYDCEPFLTPEKAIGQKQGKEYAVAKIIQEQGIKTVVLNWLPPHKLHLAESILSKCKHIMQSTLGEMYLHNDKVLLLFLPIGAPNAAASVEELRWMGITNFIAMGSAGCIDERFDESKILVVDRAIRDEGTSYHYIPPATYIEPDKDLTRQLCDFLKTKDIKFERGTTWTTDAFYRETKSRIAKRKSQGAIAVEMESSALAAVCKFHNLKFCQFLYFSDIVKQDNWSWRGTRESRHEIRAQLIELALEFAKTLYI